MKCFLCYKEIKRNEVVEVNSNGIIYPYCESCAPKRELIKT